MQSQQLVQEAADRAFNYLAEYRMTDNKVVRLADDELRTVNLIGHDRYAYGSDTREYDQNASYSGRRYEDVYAVDLKTGQRKALLKKHIPSAQVPSPDGKSLLYWGADAQWWVADVATGATRELTKGVPTVFADTSDDHNNLVTPPGSVVGWSKDGSAVLLSDAFDVWKVPANGGAAVNLTGDGKKTQVRYQRLYAFDTRGVRAAAAGGGRGGRGGGNAAGIDLSRPLYFATYGEWTKKEGLAKVDPSKPGAEKLVSEDAKLTFQKAKDADVYVFTKQTSTEFPNYYVAGTDFKPVRQLTDVNPQQKDFAWSSGVKLINYTSAKGDKLQGALYLPANYQPGKKYLMLVTIYEKRSNLANSYVTPNETSTPNRSIYTNRGYAVFDPDIVYKVNDPGMSAVWCVIPAVKAAIATGMIDSANVVGGVNEKRLLNRDGTFNQRRRGLPLLGSLSVYHYMLTISWSRFIAIVVSGYAAANALFALAYLACGVDSLIALPSANITTPFWRAFFFSVETLATIGYGNVTPNGMPAHFVMTAESLVGLLIFALGTGILFSRFSRPTAAVVFSSRAVVAPYRGITALMFRITNGRSNQLVELEVKLQFSRIEGMVRKYDQVNLERSRVTFFPLSWTIVHPIDERSPLFGMTPDEMAAKEAEFLILLSGTDETFSQTVHARSSYKPDEIRFGHRFVNIYNPMDDDGVVSIDVRKLSETEPAEEDATMHTATWHHTGHFAGFAPPRK